MVHPAETSRPLALLALTDPPGTNAHTYAPLITQAPAKNGQYSPKDGRRARKHTRRTRQESFNLSQQTNKYKPHVCLQRMYTQAISVKSV